MGSAEKSSVVDRLKREECERTKHDSKFSEWKVLVGPSDWENYSQGKEGAARYRVHNLPTTSGPGLYELGIAVSCSGLGHDVGKLGPDDIVVVYLGQADNVRSRLQRYGRSGAHLGNNHSTGHWNDPESDSRSKGLGLFEEIFSRGHSIVYRWASVNDKGDAVKTEARLLDTFDYAWNKGGNGTRRPSDILQKLERSTFRFQNTSKKLLFFGQGQVGIKIQACKPSLVEKCTIPADGNSKNFLPRIFKFNRSQPRSVSDKCGINEDFIHICGFIMNDGIPCRRPLVPGRKRCEEHKGKRIKGSSSEAITKGNTYSQPDRYLDSSIYSDQYTNTTCGVNLGNGMFCKRPPVVGRKRCEEHKGMRVNSFISKPTIEDKFHLPSLSSVFITSGDWRNNIPSHKIDIDRALQYESSNRNSSGNKHSSTICGATLGNGSFCTRQPVQGNKRCWQHKGRRVDSTLPGINNSFLRFDALACGVTLQNGSVCMRAPVHGRKRCEQHKGMRVASSY